MKTKDVLKIDLKNVFKGMEEPFLMKFDKTELGGFSKKGDIKDYDSDSLKKDKKTKKVKDKDGQEPEEKL